MLYFTGIIMADKYEEKIKSALQNEDMAGAAEIAQEYLDEVNNVRLNIAITGEGGSGKSTLVNALRGIKNKTPGAAPTGPKETTMEPTAYIHPQNDKIIIWDLPGIGTVNFTADKYLEDVGFEKYDFFIIVSSERFRENDAKLAKEIQKKKKKFYFVRSKIDNSVRDEKRDDPNVKEEEVLNIIRNNCTEELKKLGFESSKVFLISGCSLHLYELNDLRKTLLEELLELQRDVLLLALPNISLDVIEEKKKTLESKIKWLTFTSTAVAAVPVPGISEGVDLKIISKFTQECKESLGLTPELLQKVSDLSGVPLEDLKAELKSPLTGGEITKELVLKVLAKYGAVITAMAAEGGARFVPIVGIPVAMALSSVSTYYSLKYILNSLVEDATRVFMKAVSRSHL
uniref:IRG-type G domain-containing protein n=1 Tax=Neogobius melanostomus TaxID=47308 RepID=A0A8C6TZ94_9GOBI